MSLCIFLSRTVCAEGQRADSPGKRIPLIPWLAAFTSSPSSWSGSSTERKAAYIPPKGNFPIMHSLNASWEGFQVPAIPLGSFYCASCHHPCWLAQAVSGWDCMDDSQIKFLSPTQIQNSQQQNYCHAHENSLEIIFCIKKDIHQLTSNRAESTNHWHFAMSLKLSGRQNWELMFPLHPTIKLITRRRTLIIKD